MKYSFYNKMNFLNVVVRKIDPGWISFSASISSITGVRAGAMKKQLGLVPLKSNRDWKKVRGPGAEGQQKLDPQNLMIFMQFWCICSPGFVTVTSCRWVM